MANIFKQNKDVNNKVKRNNFDLSFQNHLTMKFGTLYPVLCKEVVPGDSFRIDSAFGLKFMPLVFPVQSGMRATMHFFYCRNKNLWKNWENWISNLEPDHVHPYISQNIGFFKTGSLADYIDIPTVLISSEQHFVSVDGDTSSVEYTITNSDDPEAGFPNFSSSLASSIVPSNIIANDAHTTKPQTSINNPYTPFPNYLASHNTTSSFTKVVVFDKPLPAPFTSDTTAIIISQNSLLPASFLKIPYFGSIPEFSSNSIADSFITFWESDDDDINHSHSIHNVSIRSIFNTGTYVFIDFSTDNADYVITNDINQRIQSGKKIFITISFGLPRAAADQSPVLFLVSKQQHSIGANSWALCNSLQYLADVTMPVDLSQCGKGNNPFGGTSGKVALNALPFRAYQSIYNAYYRNWQNQPYLVNGEPVYNQYIDENGDGADVTDYHLYQRNYELDFLTSGLPSPQQGNAPLVGMSALGTITIQDEDGLTTAKAQLADDGNTITGVEITSPIASRAHALTLAEIASAGMSINDFRNTNALQHWLEVNMRKGYRYLDFIAGHHDVEPKYKELDMPEFIGGYSRDVQVNSILNQTASPDSDPLGSFAGVANCFGGSKHSITHFCDDYGWIIGILCVVPQPAYSQLLPKHFIKRSPLDYYFPEFSQIGMQPVTYEEVCPVQSYAECLADNTKSMQDTFCYQRPNYDMVSYVDQVHGNFRTDLRNFLINRLFASRPELGDDFLQINPDEVNDIFQVTTPENDVIAGQVVFKISAKRPVPRIHMPSLGR